MRSWTMLALVLASCGGPGASAETAAPEDDPGSGAEATDTDSAAVTTPAPEEAAEASAAEPRVPPHGPLSEADLRRGLFARLGDRRFPSCRSGALPPAYRRRTSGAPSAEELAGAVSMSLPEGTVSAGTSEGTEAAVYLSTRFDPPSPAEDHGYRVRLRDASGNVEDLALGISFRRPFILVHNPMVPFVEGGVLALEADVRELDDTSLEWPLLAGSTRTLREAHELVVQCPLGDLRRDRDEDGLTDLEEERLLTDPWDADTDGDGVRDAEDVSPLASAAPSTTEEQVWLEAFRALVRPELGEGLALVVRSGSRIGPSEGSGRVLVLREDELSAYARRFGRRPFVVLAVTMQEGDQAADVLVSIAGREARHRATLSGGSWVFANSEPARPRRGRSR